MARELIALGEQPRIEPSGGGVSWSGDARSVMRANLWLRTASRVVVRVARFRATQFFELEQRAKRIRWDAFLAADRQPEFRVTARKSKLYHSDAIAERLLSAVGGYPRQRVRLSARGAKAESRESNAENQLFVVRVVRDVFEISADTSGPHLHMRGYRQAVAKAPLRETLAAALLLAADWSGDAPLIDPFCGSGTIPVEGAWIARRIAPGLSRRFAFQQWPGFDERLWTQLIADARATVKNAAVRIVGSDRDGGAIESAHANAARAGVAADIDFAQHAISDVGPTGDRGLVATNPPYGKRVRSAGDIRNLYAQFGNVLARGFQGWRVALYAPDRRVADQTGVALEEMFRTTNGGIPVFALTGTCSLNR